MIKYIVESTLQEKPIQITCDKCGKKITSDDIFEWQEAYSIKFTGGFGSLFGDGTHVNCDLCQNCLYDLIKDYFYTINPTLLPSPCGKS